MAQASVDYAYDADNRLTLVSNSADPDDTAFVYDAGGARIRRVHGDDATYYIGPIEIETDGGDVVETHSIYSLGGGVNAVRVVASAGDDGEVTFTFGDHLGSSSTIWQAGELGDTGPGVTSYQRYYPYGEPRDDYNPNLPTDHTFTGQISDGLLADGGTGLMYYRARYYDPEIARFAAADTIVPNPGNPQDLNRYTYVGNNPVNGTDPSGHEIQSEGGYSRDLIVLMAGTLGSRLNHEDPSRSDDPRASLLADMTNREVIALDVGPHRPRHVFDANPLGNPGSAREQLGECNRFIKPQCYGVEYDAYAYFDQIMELAATSPSGKVDLVVQSYSAHELGIILQDPVRKEALLGVVDDILLLAPSQVRVDAFDGFDVYVLIEADDKVGWYPLMPGRLGCPLDIADVHVDIRDFDLDGFIVGQLEDAHDGWWYIEEMMQVLRSTVRNLSDD